MKLRCSVSLLLLGWMTQLSIAQEIQFVEPAVSTLPRGRGLAASFPGDREIERAPSVIFADNFESEPLGAKWDEMHNKDNKVLSIVDASSENAVLGSRSVQVTTRLGESDHGGFNRWFEPTERLYIRFYTKFAKDCDYVHHFCTLRANRSLKGGDRWSGFGGAGLRPDGTKRFSTALEPWGDWGNNPPPGKWNFYTYWHEMKPSPDGKFWGNSFRPETQPSIERGTWICVEFMLLHNTPGKPDGEQAYWVDGQLMGHWTGFNWRTDSQLMANSFTLESYVTDRWTKQQENRVFFDNVVIASEYIGPSAAGQ